MIYYAQVTKGFDSSGTLYQHTMTCVQTSGSFHTGHLSWVRAAQAETSGPVHAGTGLLVPAADCDPTQGCRARVGFWQ